MKIVQKAQCIACHATDVTGNPTTGAPSLHGIGDVLTKDQIVDTITNGKAGGMPPFKSTLSADEINQLATWLSKQKKAA